MSGNLFVQTEGLQTFSQAHSTIAGALSPLTAGAAPGVQDSHGPIAVAANAALNRAVSGRGGTVQATTTSSTTISELLTKAAQAYERGDIRSAEELRAAADAMDGGPAGAGSAGAGSAGAAGAGAGPAGAGGADPMGQMLGQIGGQVGQLAGMAMAPLQGLAQLPQLAMQGVQQAVQAATQAAGMTAGEDALALEDAVSEGQAAEELGELEERDDDRADEAAAGSTGERAPTGEGFDGRVDGQAAPAPGAGTEAPDAARAERAQTRPPVL